MGADFPYLTGYALYKHILSALQYGLLTFFIAPIPFVMTYAVISNLIRMRKTAQALLETTRRPVPRKLKGIGMWSPILLYLTYFSVLTNTAIVMFTSNYVNQYVYKFTYGSDQYQFMTSMFSRFLVSDLGAGSKLDSGNKTECHYRGYRYPPEHPNRYEFRREHYKMNAIKLILFAIFVHFLLFVTGVLAYTIRDIPNSIKEIMLHQSLHNEHSKVRYMDDTFKMKQRSFMINQSTNV